MKIVIPVDPGLADELLGFWREIFGDLPDVDPAALAGHDAEHNRYYLYVTRNGERLAGTCMATHSKKAPSLGGFGEVATAPDLRGRGIGTRLCRQAVEDFKDAGGTALFLGTENPAAARIYHRLGWRKLASTIVHANIAGDDTPEAFLVNYFRQRGVSTVEEGTPSDRVPMIPLIVTPHDWRVLDANLLLYSSRYCLVRSCMGLYPKYDALAKDDRGAWFAAHSGGGRVVGLSTARLDGSGGCQVDGFTHQGFGDAWERLVTMAAAWGETRVVRAVWAAVSAEDEERQAMLEAMGFRKTGPAREFDMDGRLVGAARMELS